MADEKIDLDTLSDDEFKALTPEQVTALMTQEDDGETPNVEEPNPEIIPNDDNGEEFPDPDASVEDPDDGEKPSAEPAKEPEEDPEPKLEEDPNKEPAIEAQVKKVPEGKGNEKPAEPDGSKKPDEKTPKDGAKPVVDNTAAAVDFFTKVSAPFKADGKDIQVRSPEDAIRLMQMGVNYSRRMEELKPLRAIDQMLKDNKIDSVDKLNELIDISKGDPAAIQKLLKDKGIDPLDIDTSKEHNYTPKNYQADPKDTAFKDAIDATVAAEGGPDLIKDINKDWDNQSKEALRDQPSIFENLLEQKRTGVYEKINAELTYQRTMGFLKDVPFIQAYHQVGDAMQKAGVFGSTTEVQSKEVLAPIDTGVRKAAPKPKTEQPNPNLSSQPRNAPSSTGASENEPDYSALSDADFLKLAPPG